MTTATIQQTIDDLRLTLTHYIEATYHIGHPHYVERRRKLLKELGGIYQAPYLESTPRYQSSKPYTQIDDLPVAALEALRALSDAAKGKPVIYPSPYTHQLQALKETLNENRNLMIMTGTGSGKTESFLLPILGKLAREARDHSETFQKYHAVRALVLYPMNALVNDQLGRLRTMFGDPRTIALFEKWAKRPALFARYTSRTPYADYGLLARTAIVSRPSESSLGKSKTRSAAMQRISQMRKTAVPLIYLPHYRKEANGLQKRVYPIG
jgi:ATP-dependent helicase YprA (DUF1998 family)